jgi:hypothetical protein
LVASTATANSTTLYSRNELFTKIENLWSNTYIKAAIF